MSALPDSDEFTSAVLAAAVCVRCSRGTAVRTGDRASLGLFRCRLAAALNLRITPELVFVPDGSIEHGARISELLHQLDVERAARDAKREENKEPEQ